MGEGPFPTECFDDVGRHLQQVGHEVGTTTGRSRRCGWLDVVVLRYSTMINGYTCINLTKLDVLSGLETVRIGVDYVVNGARLESMPSSLSTLGAATVTFEDMPGWSEDISGARSLDDLPPNCRRYVERVQELIGIPIKYIGVGPDRDATIVIS